MEKRIRISHNTFINLSREIEAKNIVLEENAVTLYTNEKGIRYLELMKYPYELLEDQKRLNKVFLKNYTFYIIGVMIFIASLYINSLRISRIEINGNYPINRNVILYLEKNLKHIGPLTFLDSSLEGINQNLRANYSTYEWISVEKVGNVLSVNISESPINYQNQLMDEPGDIVAKKSGIIKYYLIYNGKKVIEYNDYVKKGDLLVSANLTYGQENVVEKKLVQSRGLILAETYEEVKIVVPKQYEECLYTGNVDLFEQLNIFGHSIYFHKDNEFRNYDEINIKKFDILGFLSYFYVERKEKSDIITIYSLDDAKSYAKNLIEASFKEECVCEKEQIMDMLITSEVENDNFYEITILVKKLESIGKFVRR